MGRVERTQATKKPVRSRDRQTSTAKCVSAAEVGRTWVTCGKRDNKVKQWQWKNNQTNNLSEQVYQGDWGDWRHLRVSNLLVPGLNTKVLSAGPLRLNRMPYQSNQPFQDKWPNSRFSRTCGNHAKRPPRPLPSHPTHCSLGLSYP